MEALASHDASGAVLFSPTSIFYLVGFHFLPTERPMALILRPNGLTHLFVPRLEHEHAEKIAHVDTVSSYLEYPGEVHPMNQLKDVLIRYGMDYGSIGVDSDGYSSPWGYRGPRLSQLLIDVKVQPVVGTIVEDMRMCKSDREIALIRESCRWGNLAHALLQEYSHPGAKEIEISNRASSEETSCMLRTAGPIDVPAGGGRASAC